MYVVEAMVVGPALRMVWKTTGRGLGPPGLGPLVKPGHSSTSNRYGATGIKVPVDSASCSWLRRMHAVFQSALDN
jgi:hypothetical protein